LPELGELCAEVSIASSRGSSFVCKNILLESLQSATGGTMEPTDGKQRSNILLVHGAFADGSIWGQVIETLQHAGFNVVASQLPLTSFTDDVRTVKRDLVGLHGPTVVVGHSYGGNVITQATSGAANVAGLVYVAAFAPDSCETIDSIRTQYPPLPSAQYFVPVDPSETPPFLIMQRDHVHQFFCQDVEPRKARALAATEGPTSATVFTAPIQGSPAWRQFPTWYQISNDDKMIQPAAQKMMANRAAPPDHIISMKASHASMLSHSEQLTKFIEQAAHHSALMSH
jgi:pimeloyl-ACP methyl ester carboxylesterase